MRTMLLGPHALISVLVFDAIRTYCMNKIFLHEAVHFCCQVLGGHVRPELVAPLMAFAVAWAVS